MPTATRRGVGLANSVLHRLPDHSLHFLPAADAGRNAGIPRHEEASDGARGVRFGRSPNWRIVVLGMMMAVLTTTTFYFVTVYTPTFGKTVLKLSTPGRAAGDAAGRGDELHLESGRRRAVRPDRPQAGAAGDRMLSRW